MCLYAMDDVSSSATGGLRERMFHPQSQKRKFARLPKNSRTTDRARGTEFVSWMVPRIAACALWRNSRTTDRPWHRVPVLDGAADRGLCAFEELAHNGPRRGTEFLSGWCRGSRPVRF